ncbi:hypothetical protein ACIHAR_35785 [Streptomyces sp. NPDC052016]|uniref:hypothetical protein n=1 Tax=Streptomyces sp. NPDC052016 TaxID=3365680 RepID=UPI0037D4ACB5
MRRPTWTQGRRGAVLGASAVVVVCTGGLLAADGGGRGEGYVAVGAAPGASGAAVPPTGEVRLLPLDEPAGSGAPGATAGGPGNSGSGNSGSGDSAGPAPGASASDPSAETSAVPGPGGGTGSGPAGVSDSRPDGTTSPSAPPPPPGHTPAPPPDPPSSEPARPAALTVGAAERTPTDRRWCERVSLPLHNSGGTAVRSGTVTLGTHIIDSIGIDWATIESTHPLPTPISPGARERGTWTVCVDAWRVPLGMRVETRDVSVRWE